MPSEAPIDRSQERRLHPVTLLLRLLAHARSLLLPAIAVLTFARGERWELWLALLFVPFALLDVFRYFTLRWSYAADELVLRQGLVFQNVRHIPYARIQNVDLEQKVLHRAFKVAKVRIETAGGIEPEAVLDAIGLDVFEELRARVFAGRASHAAAGASAHEPASAATGARERGSGEVLVALQPLDIVLLSLRPVRALAMIAAGFGILNEYGFFESEEVESGIGAWLESAPSALLGAVLVAGTLAFVALLSFGATAVAYWGFKLEQVGDAFRIQRGLFTREVRTLPRRRVQLVEVRRTLIGRLFDRVQVSVTTAGGESGRDGAGESGGVALAPLLRARELPALLERIRPGLTLEAIAWEPLAKGAVRRTVVGAWLRLAPPAALAFFFGPIAGGVALGAATVLAVLVGVPSARGAAYARAAFGIVWRRGLVTKTTTAAFVDKIQAVVLDQGPFDRRNEHATLVVDSAGGFTRSLAPVRVHYVARERASELRDDLVACAARARFRW